MREPTAEVFLRDVKDHLMTVKLDANGYRHIVFKQPGNSNMWFELVTWPWHLSISGDMGTWVFARVDDMFKFFRSNREGLNINASYWGEKLTNGVSGGGRSTQEFSAEVFKAQVLGQLENWKLSPESLAEVVSELESDVFTRETKHESYRALFDFACNGVQFDCDIPDGLQYKYHFIWCLYAIAWGIQQYDATAKLDASPRTDETLGSLPTQKRLA